MEAAMRIIKEAEERKNEILDAADELFGQKGFDGTSTGDILQKVGIARGTLYYHFKSKEDIMDALIERYNCQIISAAKAIAGDKSLSVYERIPRTVLALNVKHDSGKEIMEQMHKPQNALMHQKTQRAIVHGITPIFTELIEEGIEQGLFHTPYPYESMEMLITYSNTVFDSDWDMTEDERSKRVQAFVYNMERLFGAAKGSLAQQMIQLFDEK